MVKIDLLRGLKKIEPTSPEEKIKEKLREVEEEIEEEIEEEEIAGLGEVEEEIAGFPFRKILIWAGAGLVIIFIILIGYWMGKKVIVSRIGRRPAVVKEVPPSEKPAVPEVSPALIEIWREINQGKYKIEILSSLISSVPEDLNISFVSLADNRIAVEAFSETRDALANFRIDLKNRWDGKTVEIISFDVDDFPGDGKFRSSLYGSIYIERFSIPEFVADTLQFTSRKGIEDYLKSSAARFNLQLLDMKSYSPFESNGYQKYPLKIKVKGKFSSMMGFIKDISSSSGNYGISKIFVYRPWGGKWGDLYTSLIYLSIFSR